MASGERLEVRSLPGVLSTMRILLLIPLIALAGCASDKYTTPNGTIFEHDRCILQEQLASVEFHFADGSWVKLSNLNSSVDPQATGIIGAVGSGIGNIVGQIVKAIGTP